jgi:hypothetical protein
MFCPVLEFREKKWTFTKVEEVMWIFSYSNPRRPFCTVPFAYILAFLLGQAGR